MNSNNRFMISFLQFIFLLLLSLTTSIYIHDLSVCSILQSSLSIVIQHYYLVNSYCFTSILVNVLKWKALCESGPTEGLPFLIESTKMKGAPRIARNGIEWPYTTSHSMA